MRASLIYPSTSTSDVGQYAFDMRHQQPQGDVVVMRSADAPRRDGDLTESTAFRCARHDALLTMRAGRRRGQEQQKTKSCIISDKGRVERIRRMAGREDGFVLADEGEGRAGGQPAGFNFGINCWSWRKGGVSPTAASWWRLSAFVLVLVLFGGVEGMSTKIVAVKGGQAELPCDLTPPEPGDEVYMVLWFKRRSQTPIYTLDVRDRELSEGMHRVNEVWSNDFRTGKQANFLALAEPPMLSLVGVDEDDAAPYTCRVDFRHSQTRYSKVELTVIVPPERPVVRDEHGMQIRSLVGPKNEGDDLTLTCETKGGDPTPTLTWWLGSSLLDNSFMETSPGVYKNKLHLQSLKRQDLQSVLTCQASNNNISLPQSESIKLDMNLRPQSVKISGDVSKQVSAGKQYKLICSASGSRPPAVLTWWIGGRQIAPRTDGQGSADGDRTESVLLFNPTRLDDGKTVKCQARNPNLDHVPPLEDSQVLRVLYPPVLELRYGNKLNPENIKVGDDAYFECDVRSSPPLKSLLWKKGEEVIKHNKTAGIIVVNQTLVLQNLRETQAGSYRCVGENSEGTTDSNVLELKIKYPPKCKDSVRKVYGLSIHEVLNVSCNVDAEPPATEFDWTFNSSSTEASPSSSPAGKANGVQEGSSPGATVISKQVLAVGKQDFLIYSPRSASDYGDIACKAKNSVGDQVEPCWFQVIEAGPPDPLENCSIHNRTDTWLHVECDAGFDGGSTQQFVMELWDPDFGMLVRRIVTDAKPSFTVGNLDDDNEEHSSTSNNNNNRVSEQKPNEEKGRKNSAANAKTSRSKNNKAATAAMSPAGEGGTKQDGGALLGGAGKRSFAGMSLLVVLYSKNAKGQSGKATLEARMPQVMENRMGKGESGRLAIPLLLSPIIAILFGVASVLVTVTVTVCAVLKCRLYQKRRRETSSGSTTPANNNAPGAGDSSGSKDPTDHLGKSLIKPGSSSSEQQQRHQGSSSVGHQHQNHQETPSKEEFTGNRSPDILAHLLEAPPSDSRDLQTVGLPHPAPGAQEIHPANMHTTSDSALGAMFAYQQQQEQQMQLMGSLARRPAKPEYHQQQIMMDGGSTLMSKSWGMQQHVPQVGAAGFQPCADQQQPPQHHQMLHQSLVTLSTSMASHDNSPLYFNNGQQQQQHYFQYPAQSDTSGWAQQGPRVLPTVPSSATSPGTNRLKSALTVRFAVDQEAKAVSSGSQLTLNSNSLQRQKLQALNRQRLVPGTPLTDEIGLPTLTSVAPSVGNPAAGGRLGPEGCQQSSAGFQRGAGGIEISREQSIV